MPLLSGALLYALASTGCSSFQEGDGPPDPTPESTLLEFDDAGTLELAPREVTTLELRADSNATITLLLLGDAGDASISQATVRADASGVASVDLTAPSKPTTFVVRAQVGADASATLQVAVSEQGFTTLNIVPVYDGARALDSWSADILVGGDCGTILANYPASPVGALHVSVPNIGDVTIDSVPVGPQLAIAVRSESLAAGCISFTATKPEGTEEVMVTILDRAVLLGEAELEVSLDYAPEPVGYAQLIEKAGREVADLAFPQNTPVSTLLLDAMAPVLTPDAAYAFEQIRAETDLEVQIGYVVDGVDAHALCVGFSQTASGLAATSAEAGTERIEGRLIGSVDAPLTPSFELTSFAALSPLALGAPVSVPFSWSATADDVLVVSGLLPISGTRLAGSYMNLASSEAAGEPTTMAQTLSNSLDCAEIASQITAAGEIPGCDEACLELACVTGIEDRWAGAIASGDSLDGSTGSLQIGLSGSTVIDKELLPVELEGSWLGTLKAFEKETSVMGAATGHAPPPP